MPPVRPLSGACRIAVGETSDPLLVICIESEVDMEKTYETGKLQGVGFK